MNPQEELTSIVEEIDAYPRPIAEDDSCFRALLRRRAELEDMVLGEDIDDAKDD